MARVKTFVNGGSLLPGDLNAIQDDFEFAFSKYKDILSMEGSSGAAPSAATYLIGVEFAEANILAVGAASAACAFYLDPGDRTANSRTNKYRIRAGIVTNAVAPTTNWTFGLYPVLTWGGTSGNIPFVATVDTVVAGSTVAFNTPGAASAGQGNSGDFTAPAAGWYTLGVVNSGAAAAGSMVAVRATLQNRQV